MQRFTFESRGKRRRAEAGGGHTTAQREGRRATAPCSAHMPGVLPVSATGPAGSRLNFPVLRRRRGKETDAKHPYTFRKDYLVLSEEWDREGGGRGVQDGEHMYTHG